MGDSSKKYICFNCKDSSSCNKLMKGWKDSAGHYVKLCFNCCSIYKAGQFCEMFHSDEDGWRDCESCKQLIHCGCIVSLSDYIINDSGGITCNDCSDAKSLLSMDNPEGKARDKAWDHVTQGIEEKGKKVLVCNFCGLTMRGGGINRVRKHLAGRKGEVAPCMVVDQDVRVAIEASLKETDDKRKEKVTSNVVISDDEEQEGNKVQKGLTKNELRAIIAEEVPRAIHAAVPTILEQNIENTRKMIEERFGVEKDRAIIAEEVTRAIQAIMPTILEQNMEKTCKMIEERFGFEKEDRQVNEDVVVAGENNDIKRRRSSGKNLNTENKKTGKKVSF